MSNISVILNGFKRGHLLKEQYNAIAAQSEKSELYIWQNTNGIDPDIQPLAKCALTNFNFGVWARFAYALNCTTEYVCIFDDDTMPGTNWLKNCVETMKTHEGLLGTVGVIFHDLQYRHYTRHGWTNPNNEVKQVDIVGHSWFFKREWLGAFWRDAMVPLHNLSGEDVHFSYAIQKYLNLNTYVPPHPIEDLSLWGSMPEKGVQYGIGPEAISAQCHGSHFGRNLEHYKSLGMKFLDLH